MAKNTEQKQGKSRIRFVMLEADLADGDLTAITNAIQNALKPVNGASRTLLAPGLVTAPAAAEPPVAEVEHDDEEESDNGSSDEAPVRRSRAGPRALPVPTVLDLDLSGFAKWAKSLAGCESGNDRHLAAAYWFKQLSNTPHVTVDHVYSAYKAASWSTASNEDFGRPFRFLKSEGKVKRVERGKYEITMPGVNAIDEMVKVGDDRQ